jgi:hypothetical protein
MVGLNSAKVLQRATKSNTCAVLAQAGATQYEIAAMLD